MNLGGEVRTMNNILQFLEESSTYKTIPITYNYYSDSLTPIQMYERLREEAVYLLESGDHTSNWSRYSFIGLHPFMTVKGKDNGIHIHDMDDDTTTSVSSLKVAFEQTLEKLQLREPDIPMPFKGGGVGFVSYDAVSDFKGIERHHTDDLEIPFYHFLFCRTLLAFDHQTSTMTLIRFVRLNEEDDEESKTEKYHQAIGQLNEVIQQLTEKEHTDMFLPFETDAVLDFESVTTNYAKADYKRDVEKIKEYIRAGDIFQTVLSQRFTKEISIDGLQLYRMLRHVNPSPYMFYLQFEDYEVIGSSPERLIQVENRHLEIHPIAGTRPRGKTKLEDEQLAKELQEDEKEKAEHYMLVDLARNDIGKVASYGSVKTPVLAEITKFSRVMHMISKVTGELHKDVHPIEAFQSAFPAGTLSGAPKQRALEIINELEPNARGLYGGGVVYFGFDGQLDSCIAIRTILLKDQQAHVQAGAGVVADSDPEKEWQETYNKASALLQTIEMAEKYFGRAKNKSEEGTTYA